MSLAAYDTRTRIAVADLLRDVAEAALDQPEPTPALRAALQRWSSYVRHEQRDRAQDGVRPLMPLPPAVQGDEEE